MTLEKILSQLYIHLKRSWSIILQLTRSLVPLILNKGIGEMSGTLINIGNHPRCRFHAEHLLPALNLLPGSNHKFIGNNIFKPIAGAFGRCTHSDTGSPCDQDLALGLVNNKSMMQVLSI